MRRIEEFIGIILACLVMFIDILIILQTTNTKTVNFIEVTDPVDPVAGVI